MKLTCGLAFLLFMAAGACASPPQPVSPRSVALGLAPQAAEAAPPETGALLEAIWTAAGRLTPDKQARLKPDILALVSLSGDARLIAVWEQRLGAAASPAPPVQDFAAGQASAVIAEAGWTGFLDRAARQAPPFQIGRPEIMAAGVRLAPDTATATRLIEAMFDHARTKSTRGGMGDDFEKGDFGHVLAELGMQRCDLALFDRGRALTAEPDALRYALWRSRITGGASALAVRISGGDGSGDTRHVRQAIEGFTPVLARGYCPK